MWSADQSGSVPAAPLDDGGGSSGHIEIRHGRQEHRQTPGVDRCTGKGRCGITNPGGCQGAGLADSGGNDSDRVLGKREDGTDLGAESCTGEGVGVDAERLVDGSVDQHRHTDGIDIRCSLGDHLDGKWCRVGRNDAGCGVHGGKPFKGFVKYGSQGRGYAVHMFTGAPGPHGMPNRNQTAKSAIQATRIHRVYGIIRAITVPMPASFL